MLLPKEQGEQASLRLSEVAGVANPSSGILTLRQILETVYKSLSEGSKTSFGNLFSRMQYVHAEFSFPAAIMTQVNQLRILANKVAHEAGFTAEDSALHSGLLALRDLLRYLDSALEAPKLDAFLEQVSAQPFPGFETRPKRSFLCVVLGWKAINDESGGGIEIRVCDDEGFECSLSLNDAEGDARHWSALGKTLWQYCTLNCLNLTEITGRERCYQSNPATIIVLEPDFLLDSTSLAECFTSEGVRPEYFVVNRLLRDAAGERALQGNMINNILDELVSSPGSDYTSLFQKSLARQPISLAAQGLETALRIFNTIKDSHYANICAFADQIRGDSIQLEPSYISPKYGLQGRLDILRRSNGKYHIVELKSGRPPWREVWKQHQMQVVAYNMLIRECYARNSIGSSGILYSAASEDGLRHVVNTRQLEQELMACRNRVVGILHSLAFAPETFFGWLKTAEHITDTPFMQSKMQGISNTLNGLPAYQYQWFLEQIRLLFLEIWMEKSGGLGREGIYGHNSLWQESGAAKKERYRLLDSLRVDSAGFSEIRFVLDGTEPVNDFRVGDIVVLYRKSRPVNRQANLRGQIAAMDSDNLTIRIRGGLNQVEGELRDSLWCLEHDILETSLYSPVSSLFSFLQAPLKTRELFLGVRKPETDVPEPVDDSELETVIARILASRDYHIVQGPPGTGKTSGLLSGYLKRLYGETDRKILILSFTNRAVDEICLNLRKKEIPFIRTGHSEEIADELMDNLILGKQYKEITALLRANRVWVATVQSCNAWLNDLLRLQSIDEIIIDEASQILENSILGIIAKAPKTVLIGDQNQLPPISRLNEGRFNLSGACLDGLEYDWYCQSLMERLFRVCRDKGWTESCTTLRRHFRMHEDIAGAIQPYYGDQLVSHSDRQRAPLPPLSHPLLSARLAWIEFPPSRNAYYDLQQVKAVLCVLNTFVQFGIVADPEKDVGIVAPFRAMIHALHDALPAEFASVTIDTVERFQGSERKHIILCLPLHSVSVLRNIEALNSVGSVDRKLNVAVSRAQERLIVLGCSEICRRSRFYDLLLDKISASGKVIPYREIIEELP